MPLATVVTQHNLGSGNEPPFPVAPQEAPMVEPDTSPDSKTTGTTKVEQLMNELEAVKAELLSTKDELESVKSEFHSYREAVSKKFSGHEDELDDLEARFEDAKGGVEADETGSSDDRLPIERMIEFREQDKNHPALPSNGRESFDRAIHLFEHFGKWSNKTPKGRVITDGIRKLLETVSGESLAWRQVYRAMDKVEEWTNGMITHERTNRHGHVLVSDGRPSSEATG